MAKKNIPYSGETEYGEDGEPRAYVERHGIREVRLDYFQDPESPPQSALTAVKLLHAANDLLKDCGEKACEDVVKEVRATNKGDYAAIKIALTAWIIDLLNRYELTSPQLCAAKFLIALKLHQVMSLSTASSEETEFVRISHAVSLCDAWHWWHMEVFEEHERAWMGERAENGFAAALSPRLQKKGNRDTILRDFYEQKRSLDPAKPSTPTYISNKYFDAANQMMSKAGHKEFKNPIALKQAIRRAL